MYCSSPEKNMKFIAVHWVGLMIHQECCINHLFLYHVTRPPPCRYGHWIAYLNWLFGA
jgi:hypothetical protein